MAAHFKKHALNGADDHSAGTNGTLLGTESSAIAEKSFGTAASADLIAQRDGSGDLAVPATPGGAGMATSKGYVDGKLQGLDSKDSVRLATDAALPACTAAGSKVGKTLTADAVGILTVDGVPSVLNDRILVKNQVTGADNGIYKVTTEGTAGVAFILTRAEDADEDTEVTAELYTFVEEGTVNNGNGFTLTTDDPITVDTTTLTLTQFSGAGQIVTGAGLTKAGNTIDVGDSNKGVQANADDLQVDASEIAGQGVEQTAGGGNEHILKVKPDATGGANLAKAIDVNANGVAVKVDGTTIEENGSSQLKVKDSAIGITQLADQKAKIALSGTAPALSDLTGLANDGEWAYAYGTNESLWLCAAIDPGTGVNKYAVEMGELVA